MTLSEIEKELKAAIDEYSDQDVNDREACTRKRKRVSDLLEKRAEARRKASGATRA